MSTRKDTEKWWRKGGSVIQAEGYAPPLSEQRWAFLRKMQAFHVVSRSQAHPLILLRSCLGSRICRNC